MPGFNGQITVIHGAGPTKNNTSAIREYPMKCQELDLKAYLFAELESGERRRVDEHVSACSACREELNRLQLTQASLLMVREEELPRRGAFFFDAMFEPHWVPRCWGSSP